MVPLPHGVDELTPIARSQHHMPPLALTALAALSPIEMLVTSLAERNHQGLGNVIPFPSRDAASPVGRIGDVKARWLTPGEDVRDIEPALSIASVEGPDEAILGLAALVAHDV
jgi:hypothetical protein